MQHSGEKHTQCKITSSQFCTAGQIALDDSGVYIALGPRAEDSDPSPLLPGRPSPYPPHIVGYILPTSHSHLFLTMDCSYSKSQKGNCQDLQLFIQVSQGDVPFQSGIFFEIKLCIFLMADLMFNTMPNFPVE